MRFYCKVLQLVPQVVSIVWFYCTSTGPIGGLNALGLSNVYGGSNFTRTTTDYPNAEGRHQKTPFYLGCFLGLHMSSKNATTSEGSLAANSGGYSSLPFRTTDYTRFECTIFTECAPVFEGPPLKC